MNKQKKINLASAWEKVGMPFVLLVLIIFMLINAPNFGTVSNLFNVARSISISAILAAGMTLVIITTGIDLSVGSTIAVSGWRCWPHGLGLTRFLRLFWACSSAR